MVCSNDSTFDARLPAEAQRSDFIVLTTMHDVRDVKKRSAHLGHVGYYSKLYVASVKIVFCRSCHLPGSTSTAKHKRCNDV